MAVYAVVVDALTRRLLELAVAEAGEPAAPFAWLALGSQARREAVPSSDVDSAIVWFGEATEAEARPYLHAIAGRPSWPVWRPAAFARTPTAPRPRT